MGEDSTSSKEVPRARGGVRRRGKLMGPKVLLLVVGIIVGPKVLLPVVGIMV